MALTLIVIIMVIWVGIVGSLYASITPFIYRLWSVANYNVAYYGAMMSAERWLLSLRYHDAWFEGTSWLWTWNQSDNVRWPGAPAFGKFTQDMTSDAYRTVASRVQSIPAAGKGNVESLFATTGSKDYNMMDYREWLEIPLYIDATNNANDFYNSTNNLITKVGDLNWWVSRGIKWKFRLPPKVHEGLQSTWLAINQDIDDDTINDDVIINWWLQWLDFLDQPFSVFPTIKNDFSSGEPLYIYDNAIRESVINNWDTENNIDTMQWASNLFSLPRNVWSALTANNILPLNSIYTGSTINEILEDSKKPYLTFAITNRMQTTDGNIYPFLEWQLKACDTTSLDCNLTIPDRFFSLQWVWVVKDYTVRIFIQKPVRKTTNTANFTIIF